MDRYRRLGFDHLAIDDENNALVLRKDFHHLFDERRLVFVPKRSSDDQSLQLVIHVLLPHGSVQILPLYHNRLPRPITGVSAQFLFARFAWAIFTDEYMPFFRDEQKYAVLLFDPSTGRMTSEELQGRHVPGRANIFAALSKSRSVSPKKRRQAEDANEDNASVDNLCRAWGEGEHSGPDATRAPREKSRGRPRKGRRGSLRLPESLPGLASGSTSAASSMGSSMPDAPEALRSTDAADQPEKHDRDRPSPDPLSIRGHRS
ncbi:hypothetical protein OQA88_10770 [Cercophora sp. LCS_1]